MNQHRTVLRDEAVEALNLGAGDVAVDATLGAGGHAKRIIEAIAPGGTLIAIDADPDAVGGVRAPLAKCAAQEHVVLRLASDNFRNLADILARESISHVDGILADLGWNQNQFENGGRGFSFAHDEPLLMTYGDPADALTTARDIVNDWGEETIADVLYAYADERRSRKIARAIVEARKQRPIETSGALAAIVADVAPRRGKTHPATKTFQALRIAVNDELGALTTFIDAAVAALAAGGRLAIITFHSVEDRIVKHALRDYAREGDGTTITKKPIVPSRAEVIENPRARSAKLRIFEKQILD
jgi:16S rRNA (cytosine1402-N4)-methyltransferase